MSSSSPSLAATLRPRFERFALALSEPASAQALVLTAIVRRLARSEYGRAHGITGREGYEAFRALLPVVEYEDLRPWIARQAGGASYALTGEPAVAYEETSGSTGREKLIPYTRSLLSAFHACLELWACDLLTRGPRFRTGRLFFSISPAFRAARRTGDGTPIGFASDAEYLSPLLRRVLGPRFVAAGSAAGCDPLTYRVRLAEALLAEPRLEIISIWSPTYLLSLLELIEEHHGPATWAARWPELKLISCWTDAGAAPFVPALRERFPGVRIQGKGLLATEGPVTLPLEDAPAPVPLVDEVFLEFEAADGDILRLEELRQGREYSVILTQGGGLTRYRTHDRVVVEGRYGRTSCLRFVGRDNQVSDLVGEKLNEVFVRRALSRVFGENGRCAFLVPLRRRGGGRYVCVTDAPDAAARSPALEAELTAAFHYRQARLLGQLDAVDIRFLPDARGRYERHFLSRGLKWGDIKYASLVVEPSDVEARALVLDPNAHLVQVA